MSNIIAVYVLLGLAMLVVSIPDLKVVYRAARGAALEKGVSLIKALVVTLCVVIIIYVLAWPWVLLDAWLHRDED